MDGDIDPALRLSSLLSSSFFARLQFSSQNILGYIIQNDVIEHVLNQKLMASSVKWMSDSILTDMEPSATEYPNAPTRKLHVQSDSKAISSFQTSLLVCPLFFMTLFRNLLCLFPIPRTFSLPSCIRLVQMEPSQK